MKQQVRNNIFQAETYWINFDKWCEGEKVGKDPGNEFVLSWIDQHGEEFRQKWDMSCCSECVKNNECGYMLRLQCEKIIPVSQ